MSIRKKFEKWFELEEDYEEDVTSSEQSPRQPKEERRAYEQREQKERTHQMTQQTPNEPQSKQKPTVVSLQSAKTTAKVVLVEPRAYAEALQIADQLKKKKAVIVNLQQIDQTEGWRIIDFLSGTVYAISGEIQRIGKDIFLCTPENVEVTGEITKYLDSNR